MMVSREQEGSKAVFRGNCSHGLESTIYRSPSAMPSNLSGIFKRGCLGKKITDWFFMGPYLIQLGDSVGVQFAMCILLKVALAWLASIGVRSF